MMLGIPFLIAVVPGMLVIYLTWWFRKRNLSLLARIFPSILTIIISIALFYKGFINIRGFEGAAYGILAFFLLCFPIVALIIATRKPLVQN